MRSRPLGPNQLMRDAGETLTPSIFRTRQGSVLRQRPLNVHAKITTVAVRQRPEQLEAASSYIELGILRGCGYNPCFNRKPLLLLFNIDRNRTRTVVGRVGFPGHRVHAGAVVVGSR